MWCSSLYERNSSIKQLFKLPVGSSTGCKIYEQQYKQTVDGSKRVPEAAGRESLAITTQSITSSARQIQPQAPQQCIQNIFPRSHDCSSVIVSRCGSGWFYYMCEGIYMQPCNLHVNTWSLSISGLFKNELLCNYIWCDSQSMLCNLHFLFIKMFNKRQVKIIHPATLRCGVSSCL